MFGRASSGGVVLDPPARIAEQLIEPLGGRTASTDLSSPGARGSRVGAGFTPRSRRPRKRGGGSDRPDRSGANRVTGRESHGTVGGLCHAGVIRGLFAGNSKSYVRPATEIAHTAKPVAGTIASARGRVPLADCRADRRSPSAAGRAVCLQRKMPLVALKKPAGFDCSTSRRRGGASRAVRSSERRNR